MYEQFFQNNFFATFTVYAMVNYVYIQNVRYIEIDIYMPKYICWPRYRVLIPLSCIKLWRSQTHINYVYLSSYLLIHDKYMYITYIHIVYILFLHFHCHSPKSAFLYIYNTVFIAYNHSILSSPSSSQCNHISD